MAFRGLAHRYWGVGAVFGVWIAAVVAAAGKRAPERTWLGVDHLDTFFIVGIAIWSLVGIAILVYVNPFREWKAPEQQRRRRRGSFVFFMLLLALLFWRPQILDDLNLSWDIDQDSANQPGDSAAARADGDDSQTFDPVAQVKDIFLVLGAVTAAAFTLARLRRHTDAGEPDTSVQSETNEAELEQTIARAREQLELGPDPRSAVLEAYATMESFIAQMGVARLRTETANEHLRRALGRFSLDSEPVENLARLYERARFSDHVISSEDQRNAAAALEQAQNELALVR